MKNKIQKIAYNSLLVLFLTFNYSCSDELTERNEQFPQLNPANTDELAGTWKTSFHILFELMRLFLF